MLFVVSSSSTGIVEPVINIVIGSDARTALAANSKPATKVTLKQKLAVSEGNCFYSMLIFSCFIIISTDMLLRHIKLSRQLHLPVLDCINSAAGLKLHTITD